MSLSQFGVQLCWSTWCLTPLRIPGFPVILPWHDTSGKVCATCCSCSGRVSLMPSCIECISSSICEAQLYLSSSTIWLLIFQEIYPLFDLLMICNMLEVMLSVTTHHENYFWRILWSTGRIQLYCLQTWLNWGSTTGVVFEAKAVYFKLNNVVKSRPCPWLNISIKKACSGNSSKAIGQYDRRMGNPLQRILSLRTTTRSSKSREEDIGGWLKLPEFKKPSC